MKKLLKKVRDSQPFNFLATSGVKAVLNMVGTEPGWVYTYLPRVGEVRSRLPNGRILSLWSPGDDGVTNQVYWKGWDGFEPGVCEVFYQLARRSEVVFDVGAHVGFYSILASLVNPGGTVHSFEPLGPVHERLLNNIRLNGLTNVICSRVAAGSREETADFYHVDLGYLPSSSSLSHKFMASHNGLAKSMVPVVTLDSYVEANAVRRVDLVKIDTETTEPDVLRGMLGTLTRDHPSIICEVLGCYDTGQAEALNELLQPLGYRFYLPSPNGPVPRGAIAIHESCWNYLCTTLDPGALAEVTGCPR